MNMLLRWLGLEQGADVHRAVDGSWQLSHPLPGPLMALIIVLGLALALVNFLPQISMRLSVRIWTFVLRMAMLALLLIVANGLEWHVDLELNKKQNWAVLVDDSASMATKDIAAASSPGEGATSRYEAALTDLESLRKAADGKVNLTVESFSGAALDKSEPGQGPTLIRNAVSRMALARVHPDRLVILTDGRDSERRHLGRLGEDLQAHDIALGVRLYGSRTAPVDAGITAEPVRNVIRLGEELIIRGALSGKAPTGEQTVTLKENGTEVKSITVPADAGGRFEIEFHPKKKGQHAYTVELPQPDTVAANNAISFNVSVIEEKINVLLIEGFPRNEFKLIKGALEVDPLVHLVSICHIPGGGVYVQGEPLHKNPEQGLISSQADLFKYDVVILRDVSRSYYQAGGDTTESRLRNIVEFVLKRGGGLIVAGGQDVYRAGGYESSHLAEILPFDLTDAIDGQAQFEGLFFASVPKPAVQHPILRLLAEPNENKQRLGELRQLDGSNNVGRFKPLATPLMTRTVQVKGTGEKTIEKEAPILGYMAVGDGKVLATAVDTLWRWQLQPDFDEPPLAMMLANAVRYLAPPPGRKPSAPNVALQDGAPQVGQELVLSTELRDQNFDPIQAAELIITVARPDGTSYKIYPRDLPEEPGNYTYRVLLDQPGPYKINARYGKLDTTRDVLAGAAAGEFADLSVDREGIEPLVQGAGGNLSGEDVRAWITAMDMRPAQTPTVRDLEVWNSPLVLVLFMLLVSADCYIRKRQGLV